MTDSYYSTPIAAIPFDGGGGPEFVGPYQMVGGGTILCGMGCNGFGSASAEGQNSPYFEFLLNGGEYGGESWVNLYSDRYGRHEIASADFAAYMQVTSEEIVWNDLHNFIFDEDGTFIMVDTPEPGAASLTLLGIVTLLVLRRRR